MGRKTRFYSIPSGKRESPFISPSLSSGSSSSGGYGPTSTNIVTDWGSRAWRGRSSGGFTSPISSSLSALAMQGHSSQRSFVLLKQNGEGRSPVPQRSLPSSSSSLV